MENQKTVAQGERAEDWREVVQAAAALMASGKYTSVNYAVKTARELVAAAQKAPEVSQ